MRLKFYFLHTPPRCSLGVGKVKQREQKKSKITFPHLNNKWGKEEMDLESDIPRLKYGPTLVVMASPLPGFRVLICKNFKDDWVWWFPRVAQSRCFSRRWKPGAPEFAFLLCLLGSLQSTVMAPEAGEQEWVESVIQQGCNSLGLWNLFEASCPVNAELRTRFGV